MTTSVHIFFFYLIVIIIILFNIGFHPGYLHSAHEDNKKVHTVTINQEQGFFSHRKLMVHGSCTNRDISISQSKSPSPGIPQYIVEIVNTCVNSGCGSFHIHLHCGWFASARIVNPRIFKRLSYDDCLVNGGRPLKPSQIIRFTYSNSFMYPLAFKFARSFTLKILFGDLGCGDYEFSGSESCSLDGCCVVHGRPDDGFFLQYPIATKLQRRQRWGYL